MGHKVLAETRAKISATMKAVANRPEVREKRSADGKRRFLSSEARARASVTQKEVMTLPEVRERQSEAMARTDVREKMADAKKGKVGVLSNRWRGGKQLAQSRKNAKRRELGFLPLNEPFDGCDAHHLDSDHVVYIPRWLHQSIKHDHNTGRNMAGINTLALRFAGLNAEVLNDVLPFSQERSVNL
jgi:hypothetical protein